MTANPSRQGLSWSARLAWVLLLLLVGAAVATWGLSRWEAGARFFGITQGQPIAAVRQSLPPAPVPQPATASLAAADASRIAVLEARLGAIESQAQAAAGSAGRADAMLVAFAARRAIDRGVALGYLEPLLVQRFGRGHQGAVATIVTASRDPVRLDSLVADYEALGPTLRGGGPEEGWWAGFRRELGTVVSIHRADTPSPQPQARFDRARARLESGEVDQALAETMRMPGAANAEQWIVRARRYIAAHRALDEIESAALLGDTADPIPATQAR
ncbi:hypothetical protein LZ518_10935 [Sphingomonas sp. RB56-2]|uniref:Periplasmic heavy metal sensor n=1 Tax=Sphingomonas brevis TaxID=2908206 RepID=A0ABT0SB66_9SPHN|nr:hypothetical protein [Sphingomonas brevis]MCL6741646.1 hypothetical protein [Sphingomonas brevis]